MGLLFLCLTLKNWCFPISCLPPSYFLLSPHRLPIWSHGSNYLSHTDFPAQSPPSYMRQHQIRKVNCLVRPLHWSFHYYLRLKISKTDFLSFWVDPYSCILFTVWQDFVCAKYESLLSLWYLLVKEINFDVVVYTNLLLDFIHLYHIYWKSWKYSTVIFRKCYSLTLTIPLPYL